MGPTGPVSHLTDGAFYVWLLDRVNGSKCHLNCCAARDPIHDRNISLIETARQKMLRSLSVPETNSEFEAWSPKCCGKKFESF
jgi:hypothetical protein